MNKDIDRYFSGELSDDEKLLLLRRARKEESLRRELLSCQNHMALLNIVAETNKEEAEASYESLVKHLRRHHFVKKFVRWSVAAAVASFIAVGSATISPSILTDENTYTGNNTISAPTGQRACVELHDGTTVWLNARSSITYPSRFDSGERRVSLVGEAYFKVAADKEHPFIVSAGDAEIRATGTEFNISSYPSTEIVRTSLIEGKVEVSSPGKSSVYLFPGNEATLHGGEISIKPIDFAEHFLWREGVFAFNNEPLIEILENIKLYYDVDISVNDTSLFTESYTGKFRQRDSIDDILAVLSGMKGFKITKDNTMEKYHLSR